MQKDNKHTLNGRRGVEVYFVLYLAALLFLLPDRSKDEDIATQSGKDREVEFSIYPEKTNLNAQFYIDANGVRILQLDSINTIYANANYDNLSFQYTIIDPITNQTMELSEGENGELYRVQTDQHNSVSKFYWQPSNATEINQSYIVAVNAMHRPNSDKNKIYKAKTQFTLNIIFKNKPEVESDPTIDNITLNENINRILDSLRDSNPSQVVNNGEFELVCERSLINMPAMQKWTNTVNFYNINVFRDLKSKPHIQISGSAADRYKMISSDIQENKIVFSGIIPNSGNIRVKVSAERKSDGSIKTTTFTVKSLPIDDAKFDKVMYVGRTYLLDPNLPLINRSAYAEIRTNQEKLKSSDEGTKFYWTPLHRDIGKNIMFRRYLDGKLIEEDLRITVMDFPNPEILAIQKISNNELEIKTKSFGNYNADKNLISLITSNSEINYRELYGSLEESSDKFSFIQTFRITLLKNDRGKITFTVKDKSGKASATRSFSL